MASPSSPDNGGTATTETAGRSIPTPRSGTERVDAEPDSVAERFVAGDLEALAAVYQLTAPLVFTVALRSLGVQHDAEVVTRVVYARAWRSRHTYDPSRRQLRAWLVGLTRQAVADQLGDWARDDEADASPDGDELDQQAPDKVIVERVIDAVVVSDGIARLDEARRHAIELSFFDGLAHTQIAESLDRPVDSVKGDIKRGLAQLRRELGVVDGAP
jgi:RNA polymerase sigma-70 factor (ECF subfamily)